MAAVVPFSMSCRVLCLSDTWCPDCVVCSPGCEQPALRADVEMAINELYSRTGEVLLGGLLRASSSAFANVVKGVASNSRVLVGTGDVHKRPPIAVPSHLLNC